MLKRPGDLRFLGVAREMLADLIDILRHLNGAFHVEADCTSSSRPRAVSGAAIADERNIRGAAAQRASSTVSPTYSNFVCRDACAAIFNRPSGAGFSFSTSSAETSMQKPVAAAFAWSVIASFL